MFDHWASRNQDRDQGRTRYTDVHRSVQEQGIAIRRIEVDMDWEFFEPLTEAEALRCPRAPSRRGEDPVQDDVGLREDSELDEDEEE